MKKAVSFLNAVFIFIICAVNAFAGDIPESLLIEDNSQVFFAEVLEYIEDNEIISVIPTKRIKGDVVLGGEISYYRVSIIGDFALEKGSIYLLAYCDNNPVYIFETTSRDTKTMELKHIEDMDMWLRFEEYLNNGDFEKAETKRLERLGIEADEQDKPSDIISGQGSARDAFIESNYESILILSTVITAAVLLFVVVYRRRKR